MLRLMNLNARVESGRKEWKEGRESELLIVNRTKESSVSSGRRTDATDGSEEMDEGGRIPRRAMC